MQIIPPILRTVRPEANWLFLISLALLIFKLFVLNQYTEIFNGAYELGLIFEAILVSVLASYIFYFFVVHIKEYSDRLHTKPYIQKHALLPVGDCVRQLFEFARIVNTPMPLEKIDEVLISSAFQKIDPYSNAPLILGPSNLHANWFQYFDYHRNRTRESISRVFSQLIYVDAELISILSAIDECSHFSHLNMFLNSQVSNQNMLAWVSDFTSYCELCQQLNDCCEKTFGESVKYESHSLYPINC